MNAPLVCQAARPVSSLVGQHGEKHGDTHSHRRKERKLGIKGKETTEQLLFVRPELYM